ncbi:MAG: ribosome small subunit-dependent GTPase A [candidate division Zixibacteria bacterium HGW-Zixibacteria-1]|nr:MAG: ribosome small subunit-dependent GTPase A [candidate division Zixibacteria bacterium HGW-Zixibacteria-1]
MDLTALGWNDKFNEHFDTHRKSGLVPARVALEQKERYSLFSELGELAAQVSGRMRHISLSRAEFPAVGDWVAVDVRPEEKTATIHAVLPRRSVFSRTAVLGGAKTDEQVLAANIDTVFLVSGLDSDFNLRRIERYVSIAWNSGASPVIILNKADLCDDVDGHKESVESVALGVPLYAVSAVNHTDLDFLREHVQSGRTSIFLGSSGVGKSTLINRLLGMEQLKVGAVRDYDGKGRHTTTSRQMILLPCGGIVIDTPGLREIQAWSDDSGIDRTFGDIEELAAQCRFADCTHNNEPGCAVREAIKNGSLDAGRLRSYIKLQKEVKYMSIRKDQRARIEETRKWKRIEMNMRQRAKFDKKLRDR